MNNAFKKMLSLILSALIVLAVFPLSAFSVPAPELVSKVVDGVSEYGMQLYHYEDRNGNTVDTDKSYRLQPSSQLRRAEAVPSAYSSVDNGYVTSVKNQGNAGVCWSFTASALMESYAIKNMGANAESTDFSEAHLVWFSGIKSTSSSDLCYGDGPDYDNPYNYGGNWQVSASAYAKGSGPADESDFPFYPDDISQMGNYPESTRYVHNYGLMDRCEILTTASAVKQAIITNGAVGAGYWHDDSYLNYDGVNYVYPSGKIEHVCSKAAYYTNLSNESNHAITIVGWDDNYSRTNFLSSCRPTSNGAWLVKNSWSELWGFDGYFWISYQDASLSEFYTMTMSNDFESVTTYNGTPAWSYFTFNGSSKMANFFTADKNLVVEGAGFFVLDNNMNVTVSLYTGNTSSSDPASGTLRASKTLSCNAGYYTISFPEEVTVAKGQKYSIVVDLVSATGGQVRVPVEGSYGYAQSSQSFFYYTNYSMWLDANDYSAGNTFVNAYTRHVHQFVETSRTQGDCLHAGVITSTCSICGKTQTASDTAPAGHSEYVSIQAKEPTCTSAGNTQQVKCSVCGEIMAESEVIPAKDHTPGNSVMENYVDSNCTAQGSFDTVIRCTDCATELSRVSHIIEKKAHSQYVSAPEVEATCSTAGSTAQISCSECGNVLVAAQVIPKNANHIETSTLVKSEAGDTIYTKVTCCEICGEQISSYHFDTAEVSTSTQLPDVSGETGRELSPLIARILYIIRLIAYTLSFFI